MLGLNALFGLERLFQRRSLWRMRSLQKFAAVHATISNHFNQERSLSRRTIFLKANRTAALSEWRGLLAA